MDDGPLIIDADADYTPAIEIFMAGGIIAYPTETFYGTFLCEQLQQHVRFKGMVIPKEPAPGTRHATDALVELVRDVRPTSGHETRAMGHLKGFQGEPELRVPRQGSCGDDNRTWLESCAVKMLHSLAPCDRTPSTTRDGPEVISV